MPIRYKKIESKIVNSFGSLLINYYYIIKK